MAERAPITPEVIAWARKTAKMSVEDAAAKMTITPERLMAWERGEEYPTMKQAEKLAKLYRRSFAIFFLPQPPRDFQPIRDFRTIGEGKREYSTALTFMIREIQAKQAWMSDFLKEAGEESLGFIGSFSTENQVEDIARSIVKTLEIKRDYTAKKALKYWTEQAEAARIFVCFSGNVHTKMLLSVEEVRGFALSNEMAPFIFINSADSETAQLFTLVHELAHLWINASGVSNPSETSLPEEKGTISIETLCNKVAAEALMPAFEVSKEAVEETRGSTKQEVSMEFIERMAKRFGVSSLAMLTRARTLRWISQAFFKKEQQQLVRLYAAWKKKEEEKKAQQGGGADFYRIQIRRNSRAFTHIVYDFYKTGRISMTEASRLLHVKVNNFPKLETYLAA